MPRPPKHIVFSKKVGERLGTLRQAQGLTHIDLALKASTDQILGTHTAVPGTRAAVGLLVQECVHRPQRRLLMLSDTQTVPDGELFH